MDASVIAAAASICAALIALFGALFNRRKTEEAAEQLKRIDECQHNHLTLLKSELDRISFVANSNHSKRVEVITEAYLRLAEIKFLMEAFVVPMFPQSVPRNTQTILDAVAKFEDLYKFCSMKAIFFSDRISIMEALGKVMGYINQMQNLAQSDSSSWHQQASVVIDGVTPVLQQIRNEVRRELSLDL